MLEGNGKLSFLHRIEPRHQPPVAVIADHAKMAVDRAGYPKLASFRSLIGNTMAVAIGQVVGGAVSA